MNRLYFTGGQYKRLCILLFTLDQVEGHISIWGKNHHDVAIWFNWNDIIEGHNIWSDANIGE